MICQKQSIHYGFFHSCTDQAIKAVLGSTLNGKWTLSSKEDINLLDILENTPETIEVPEIGYVTVRCPTAKVN